MAYLYDEGGSQLVEIPNIFPTPEGISFDLNEPRFLLITGIEDRSTAYSITIVALPPPVVECDSDDSLEENDQLSESYPVGAGADLTLSLCPNDEDWFTFRGREGELWTAAIFLRDFTGEVELSIGRQGNFEGGELFSQYFINGGDQSVDYLLEGGEPHYLRLRCEGCLSSIRYQLGLSRQ